MGNNSLTEIEKLSEENARLKRQLKHANNKLCSQNELLKNAPLYAWAINEKFEFTFISFAFKRQYKNLFGIELDVGKNLFELIPPEYIQVWKERFVKAMQGEEFIVNEKVPFHDSIKFFRLHIFPINTNGKITGIKVFTVETTRIIEAEKNEINSLKKLQKILQNVDDIYYEVDINGKILDVSPAIETFSKYSRNEVIGTHIYDIYANPKDRELFLHEISSKGQVKNYIMQAVDKNGQIRTISVNASLIFNDLREPEKISGIIRDITDIEKTNKDLRWLRRAIEHSPVSILITDIAGNIEYTNPFFTKTTGYTKEEAFGKNPSILKSGLQTDQFYKDLWETIKNGEIWEGEFHNKRKDGTFFWERATISPVLNMSGDTVNFIAIKEDYTKPKEDANEIMRLKAFNDQILNTMKEGILVEDKNGTIIYSNPSFSKISGYKFSELHGNNLKKIIRKKFHRKVTNSNQQKESFISKSYEIKIKSKSGKSIPVLVSGSPIVAEGKYEGLVVVFTNISKLKKHEKKIKTALEQAKISDTLKSSFLANMSHEIRTPMNAILGFADILRNERDIDEEIRDEYFSIIEDKGNELLQIISDIIDISKIESKIIDINNHEFELNDFLQSIYDTFAKELAHNNKSIKTSLLLPKSTDHIKIISDRNRLNQVFTNLLNNSRKFTEEGKIEFGYELTDMYFKFFVRDTGIGVSKQDQKIIFDRFRQAEDNYTRSFGGTGLGLNICKNLVNLLGGDIKVESELNVGSTFYFTIPQKKEG